MEKRSRIVAPRNVVNAKMMYKLYILKELANNNMVFGNKILIDFKENFKDIEVPFPISSSTIYESLYELEKNGYVVSKWTGDEFLNKRSKKIYSITDSGISYLKNHISDYVSNIEKTKISLDKIKIMLLK
ncbi:MAG: PadR family transcriptional regulator [Clostridium sp.]|uniref:PadR family transcriptional regulator n=1 Tax=Clostridium TaxID=1485 RepID=UPI0021526700|nr:PadR family transcriptional regulator [Clostridium sp. LY3-2]MCR6515782.1 PadR family transcriptional regulator [Clostridium sp. LY3-2]